MAMKFVKGFKKFTINLLAILISGLFRKQLRNVVRIEGGLGSQLISFLAYKQLRISNPNIRLEVSYFTGRNLNQGENTSSLWSWELDKYGISIDEFSKTAKFYDKYMGKILSKREGDKLLLWDIFKNMEKSKFSEEFPLLPGVTNFLASYGLSVTEKYAVMHVRRGDYLKVSTRIYNVDESMDIFLRLENFTEGPLFITSDDEFSENEKKKLSMKIRPRVVYFISRDIDLHIVHGLMRNAKMLITSNSTFSWTAGLMSTNKDAFIVSPTNFFKDNDYINNNLFRVESKWMIQKN